MRERLHAGWSNDLFILSSFDHYELRDCGRQLPSIHMGALLAGIQIGYAEYAERAQCTSANLCIESISEQFVNDAHRRGLMVYVWTVNDAEDIARMKSLGVDGLFSNYPTAFDFAGQTASPCHPDSEYVTPLSASVTPCST